MLLGDPMYDHHRSLKDPMYTTWVIYSPDVPVFRLDEGRLLDEPYLCSFLTSPAVNVGALHHRDSREDEIRRVMQERVERVLGWQPCTGTRCWCWARGDAGCSRTTRSRSPNSSETRWRGGFAGRSRTWCSRCWTRPAGGQCLGPFEQVFGPAVLKTISDLRREDRTNVACGGP